MASAMTALRFSLRMPAMLSFRLPFDLTRLFAAPSFVGDAEATRPALPALPVRQVAAAGPVLVSAYEPPPADLDQRVRASGEW